MIQVGETLYQVDEGLIPGVLRLICFVMMRIWFNILNEEVLTGLKENNSILKCSQRCSIFLLYPPTDLRILLELYTAAFELAEIQCKIPICLVVGLIMYMQRS